jgi:hypothetical protein
MTFYIIIKLIRYYILIIYEQLEIEKLKLLESLYVRHKKTIHHQFITSIYKL